ncbi:hypothetical protein XENOCAPTIV_030574 [Xenoophorus captivus]|uniref:R3H domain-containing protein n=1 Tax=Xenoophorus captivus TaxID=1517983 RepID=A0ABV0R2U7_9TELE
MQCALTDMHRDSNKDQPSFCQCGLRRPEGWSQIGRFPKRSCILRSCTERAGCDSWTSRHWKNYHSGEVGFLAEDRRINVAVTRARRHIAVVCDTQTVRNHAFLKSLVDHMTEFGVVRTAFEYLQDIVPQNYTRDPKDTKTATSSTSRKQKSQDQASIKAKQGQKTTSSTKDKIAGSQNHSKSHTSAQKDQNEGKSRYAEIRAQVENFMKDESMKNFHFPSSFNSHDRLLVHQIAEELGLVHESRGEGGDRFITVSRPVKSEPAEEPAEEKTQEEETAPALQKGFFAALADHPVTLIRAEEGGAFPFDGLTGNPDIPVFAVAHLYSPAVLPRCKTSGSQHTHAAGATFRVVGKKHLIAILHPGQLLGQLQVGMGRVWVQND